MQPRPRAATRGLVTLLRMSSFIPRHLSPPLLPPTQAQPEAFTANVVTPPRVRPVGALPAESLFLIFPGLGSLFQNPLCRFLPNLPLLLPTCENGNYKSKSILIPPDKSEKNLQVTMEFDKAQEGNNFNAQSTQNFKDLGCSPPTSGRERTRHITLRRSQGFVSCPDRKAFQFYFYSFLATSFSLFILLNNLLLNITYHVIYAHNKVINYIIQFIN